MTERNKIELYREEVKQRFTDLESQVHFLKGQFSTLQEKMNKLKGTT
jgi:chaperonin cofactor prefoldin